MLPFKSLDAASSTGPGAVKDLESTHAHHSMVVIPTGNPSSGSVSIEGSHDGANWVVLTSVGIAGDVIRTVSATSLAVRFIRANLLDLSGGSSPTVTATIGSA